MKKIILSLTLLVMFALVNHAQNNKGYIGISLGPSVPLGDLGSQDVDNEAAGWATTGAVFDLSFATKLGAGNFGISAMLRGQANPTDAQALADEFANQYPGILWTVESDAWSIGGLMFGGYSSIPISDNFFWDSRVMIGFLGANSPMIKVTGSNLIASATVTQESAGAVAFAFQIGTGFKLDLGSRFALTTTIDFLSANPEFADVKTTLNDGGFITESYDTFSQNLTTFNWTGGIAFRF